MSQPRWDGSCLAHLKGTREVEVQWSLTGKGAAGSNSLQLMVAESGLKTHDVFVAERDAVVLQSCLFLNQDSHHHINTR